MLKRNKNQGGFTPVPESLAFQRRDKWRLFRAFGTGFQPEQTKKLRPLGRGGFTLMEILVYIAILGIIIPAILAFLSWAIKSSHKAKAMREVLDNAHRAMEIMTYETRESTGIYTPTTNLTQLSLGTNHSLPIGETSSFIDFFLCGADNKTLCQKRESESDIALTSDRVEVSRLEFLQIATTTPSIQISLSINYKNPNNLPEYQSSINLSATVSLRIESR